MTTVQGALAPAPKVDDPRRDILVGGGVAAAFFAILLGWGSLTPLDAAVVAPGQITVEGHRQTIQHREGGIISAIHVVEAQRVKAGDLLIELAGADTLANEATLQAQVIDLEARKARLQAEQSGASIIQWPADFAALAGADLQEAQKAEAVQVAQLRAHATATTMQKRVLGQKASELGELEKGYQSQIDSAERQQSLIGQELKGMQSLAAQGYAPLNRVRELQRTEAQIGGERGQYLASVAQSRQQAREAQSQEVQVDTDDGDKIATELSDVEGALGDALPKLAEAKDQLARSQIKAPVSGSVVGLWLFPVGGVVAPGQRLMDIVPDKAPLMIEVRVSPNDAQDLREGQTAEIRFPTLHDRGLPILQGRLSSISADSLVDDKTGARFFTAEVSVPLTQLTALERQRNPNFTARPGLPVQVMIPLRKRTALQYLLEPFGDAVWGSFRQH